MKIYHSFPRLDGPLGSRVSDFENLGMKIIRNIVDFGLLCFPEEIAIDPPSQTENPEKKELLRHNTPEITIVQPRFCGTLCDRRELFTPRYSDQSESHADVFGPMAIGFDALRARQMGFVPAIYYTRRPIPGFAAAGARSFATQIDMLQRLKEIRDVLIALAHVEADLEVDDLNLPSLEVLDELGIGLTHEVDVTARLRAMAAPERRDVLRLFETDREFALNLVGALETFLSLFQEADSSLGGSVLTFFEEREWRIVHQMRKGTKWYCLGDRPQFMNPLGEKMRKEISILKDFLGRGGHCLDEGLLNNCWVLAEIDGLKAAEFIDEVIVPEALRARTKSLFDRAGLQPDILATEDIAAAAR